jgi:orotate phosphoribosyltransferase
MASLIPFLEYHDPPVRLHGGGESHWLIRADLMFECKPLRELVLDNWVDELGLARAHIIFIPTGGMPWAEALAERLGCTYGGPDAVPYPKGPLYVVDDVATTGESIMSVPNASKRMVVVDRGYNLRIHAFWRLPLP